jgi:hypothetical protein
VAHRIIDFRQELSDAISLVSPERYWRSIEMLIYLVCPVAFDNLHDNANYLPVVTAKRR